MEDKLKNTTPSDASKVAELMRSARFELYVVQLRVYTEQDFLRVYGSDTKELTVWKSKLSKASRDTAKYFSKIFTNDEEVIGFAYGWFVDKSDKAILSKLFVKVEYSGQGIGSSLFSAFIEWAHHLPVYVLVEQSNNNALIFYEKHGFKRTGKSIVSEGMSSVWLSNSSGRGV